MPIVQVAAESDRHSFAFSARHTFAVPGAGAAFNTWQGSGLIKDGYASGSGFFKASYLVRELGGNTRRISSSQAVSDS
jgi:hypothetical protein